MSGSDRALVNVIMGSQSDWETMRHARDTLQQFGVSCECRVLSAHRTPDEAAEYVRGAEERGVEVIIAAAGGAAHLAGVAAAHTVLPVLGVPMKGWALDGLDSLLSTVQMPRGIPVATFAIGKAGAVNAALFAVALLSATRPELREDLKAYRRTQAEAILQQRLE
ncbi:MAG TPA: 5-(carboxyamino)imidazole ribonucleotide mutase [Planctomycetaceae bacterium]|nr:5-(carboxyamino)imidazole ribonucleotide mutase [Planctomycetaceae bacterium]